VANGLILLGFLAVLFAFVVGKTRRRVGLPMTGRIFTMIITGFVIVVLVLWVANTR
jgi:uncharacterized membrane protein